nr:DUF2231 domain-containing protein [Actinomycetota bacterium]
GKPTHPPFTDFPIVAYVFAAAFDVISYIAAKSGSEYHVSNLAHDSFVAGTYTIIGGAVLSLGAALTGFWDWWKGIDREPKGFLGRAKHTQVWRTINWHATVMLTLTAIVIVDIVVRLTQYGTHYASLGVMILSVVAGILVLYGSFYGGSLVFEYQFNVESLEGSTVWDETERDQMPAEHGESER